MQRLSSLEEPPTPLSALDHSTPFAVHNTDYLQQALDTLVVPRVAAVEDPYGPYETPFLQIRPGICSPASLDRSPIGPTRRPISRSDGAHAPDRPKRKPNREYQRRFRMRSKARTKAIQAELANTKAELQKLKARNEDLLHLSSKTPDPPPSATHVKEARLHEYPTQAASQVFPVSASGSQVHLTSEEVDSMPLDCFSKLYGAYLKELELALYQSEGSSAVSAYQRMYTLSSEVMGLMFRRIGHQPSKRTALFASMMAQHDIPANTKPAFSPQLLRLLDLSTAQLKDLLHIQHVCMVKLALLEMERKVLVEPLIKQEEVSFPHDSFAALEAESNKLKENLLEAQKIKFTAGTVVFAGILTTKQLAQVLVHWPYFPLVPEMLETIGQMYGSDAHNVVDLDMIDLGNITIDWEGLLHYADKVKADWPASAAMYVPLSKHNVQDTRTPSEAKPSETTSAHQYAGLI